MNPKKAPYIVYSLALYYEPPFICPDTRSTAVNSCYHVIMPLKLETSELLQIRWVGDSFAAALLYFLYCNIRFHVTESHRTNIIYNTRAFISCWPFDTSIKGVIQATTTAITVILILAITVCCW